MKKIGQKEILDAILKEALTIKRKRELFKEAQKINQELKQLNEYGHPGAMLGWGFKNSDSPSPVMGMVTPSTYEEEKPEEECGCKLGQFPKLEKDMEDFGEEGTEEMDTPIDDVQALKDENEELKEKLAKIQDALDALNEGFFNKVAAGFQGLKTGAQTAIKAGAEAGKQQYQQTRQAQELEATKQKAISALQKRMAELNKAGQEFNFQNDIQAILKPFGLQYAKKQIVPLAEGEDPAEMLQEELDEILGRFGAMVGGAAKKIGSDIGSTVKSAGQTIGGVAKAVAQPVKQYAQQVGAAAKEAGQAYDTAQAEKQAAAQANAEKMQQVTKYNSSMFNAAIQALQNYQPAAAE